MERKLLRQALQSPSKLGGLEAVIEQARLRVRLKSVDWQIFEDRYVKCLTLEEVARRNKRRNVHSVVYSLAKVLNGIIATGGPSLWLALRGRSPRWILKGCPKCGGDMCVDYEEGYKCLGCGKTIPIIRLS